MRTLQTVLIGPSRYDDRGVVTFHLGMTPNGGLCALAGLAEDYNRRHAGRARIDYEFYDEFVRDAISPALLRSWRDSAREQDRPFVLMLCGIQTVSYARARDIALMARAEGIEVLAGGIHLSAHGPSVDFLVSCGVHVAIGEVEPIWDDIVDDCIDGELQPLYRISTEQGLRVKSADSYITAPDITHVPFPHIPPHNRRSYVNPRQLFIDSSRGCPFLCTFCVVKNVFGRTVRSREPRELVDWMIDRVRNDGVRAFTFLDDNFVRNPRHMEVLELLAEARRKDKLEFLLWLILDVESACYADERSPRGEKTRRFLQLCKDAGVSYVYMGLESTNDAVLQEMRKGVNRDREAVHGNAEINDPEAAHRRLIQRYKVATRAWHDIGVGIECGCILGFSGDTHGAGARMARDLVEIGVDIAHFYLLAPLPGSEDYARALRENLLLQNDFNAYFSGRSMVKHPTIAPVDLERELDLAVHQLWSWRNVIKRIAGGALGIGRARARSPWDYAKKQLACKITLSAGLTSHVAGGLFRRGRAHSAPRHAISDEEARRYYLGGSSGERSNALTATMLDDSSMRSLPVLGTHHLEDPVPAP